jgi:outer membrane receptor protein involved in Fe transport
VRSSIPRNSYGILAAKQISDWQFNVGVYHIGNMDWSGEGKPAPHHTRIDASIIKHFNFSQKDRITVTLAAQNLGNSRYVEFHPDFHFDPRYYATIAFTRF